MSDKHRSGFVAIPRHLLDSEMFANLTVGAKLLALWLFHRASWKPCEVLWNNKPRTLLPGQMITSERTLMRETGLTRQQVRSGLALLKKWDFATRETTKATTQAASIITLINWDTYREDLDSHNPSDNQRCNPSTTQAQPYPKQEHVKKAKKTTKRVRTNGPRSDTPPTPPAVCSSPNQEGENPLADPPKGDDVVVVDSSRKKGLVRQLTDNGIRPTEANRLIDMYPPDVIERQLIYIDQREVRKNKAGLLIRSIKENWGPPEETREMSPPLSRAARLTYGRLRTSLPEFEAVVEYTDDSSSPFPIAYSHTETGERLSSLEFAELGGKILWDEPVNGAVVA